MSKTWEVTLPIVGTAYMTVEAETEEEAIETAMNEVVMDDISEWEAVSHVMRGNVCYAPTWNASAEEVTPK